MRLNYFWEKNFLKKVYNEVFAITEDRGTLWPRGKIGALFKTLTNTMCACVRFSCVCVCERGKRVSVMYVCVWKKEVNVVCVCERRGRDSVCYACMCVCVCERKWVCVVCVCERERECEWCVCLATVQWKTKKRKGVDNCSVE